jgi:hypothetical protein
MRNISPASKNPFLELDSLYSAQTEVRKNTLVKNASKEVLDDQAISYDVTWTLLPHQILILPLPYLSQITNGSALSKKGLQVYDKTLLM